MKKVLIAMDYSQTAQKVAETGFSMAKSMNAEITLLHVIGNSNYYSSLEYSPIMGFSGFSNVGLLQSIDVEGLKKSSMDFLLKTKQFLGDDSIQILIREGDFAETILDTAKELHVDLIIMGSHSRRWLEKILMGSVTEKVLTEATIPLFIIPTKEEVE
jgi:nucleotide-binding universal stress UspA family protein